jgi:hypothetical protein
MLQICMHATSSNSTPFGRRCGVAHVIFSPLVVLMRTRARVSVHVHGRAGARGREHTLSIFENHRRTGKRSFEMALFNSISLHRSS